MIEVNLFSIPANDTINVSVGKCVARSRVDLNSLGVSTFEFVKGFLRDNLDNLESAVSNSDLISFINSNQTMTTSDFSTLRYLLKRIGYHLTVWNVTDDEDNKTGVPAGTLEYNMINHNFLQSNFPTVTKLIPAKNESLAKMVTTIVEQSGLFDDSKFSGIRNPFNILTNNLKSEEEKLGNINSSLISQIYGLLDQMGINIFCATSEE